MGKNRGMLLIAVCVLLFAACAGQKTDSLPEQGKTLRLYYLNEDGTRLVSEAYQPETELSELLQALEREPQNPTLRKAKPETVRITEYSLSANGLLTLRFDGGYQQVTGPAEVLMRAAIVKTLCQAEGVAYVEFYVNDQPLLRSNGRPVGMMKAEDFIDNTGADTEFYQDAYVSIYYGSEDGTRLVESNLKITFDGSISTEQLILNQLISGPVEENRRATIPAGTVLNKVTVKDGVCTVDLNEKFLERRKDVTEEVTVYSVVNSLVELASIYRVQFLINGESVKTYGSIDLSTPFERNLELMEEEH